MQQDHPHFELVGDPLFQLNVVLWLAQTLPNGFPIVPLLGSAGFSVFAISQSFPVPRGVRVAAEAAGLSIKESSHPDVVLRNVSRNQFAFVECKRSSHGEASSTTQQTRTHLVIAGPESAQSLGLGPAGYRIGVAFLTRDSQCDQFLETLESLSKSLTEAFIEPGAYGFLGLGATEDHLYLHCDERTASLFGLTVGQHQFMPIVPGTDPRPLYLMPYDANIDQSKEEREFCKRILFRRLLSEVICRIGSAVPPATVVMPAFDLLNTTTFGTFNTLGQDGNRKAMRKICIQLVDSLTRVMHKKWPGILTYDGQATWTANLPDQVAVDRAISIMTAFSCDSLDLLTEPAQGMLDFGEVSDQTTADA
jgi:hypothetical protein